MSAIAKIDVTVSPADGCTLIDPQNGDHWQVVHNETRESVIVTADDVVWVLDHPGAALSGERGYRRLWRIGRIECAGLVTRIEIPKADA